ncbi:uncharacterized protein LOC113373627 [Ctenocephalides felis]|uniref:uncharacterized protein LOC113373627 n=1 Tax=Ctenocephalides felis TaxID=7515 RepID=UPI000E6E4CEC|nr:uncharacterized protein LOC113373627 [Ctenocephalides felis]
MNFLSCFLAVVLVGAAVAYDFKDSYYNELLQADLEDNLDIEGALYNHRVTRETENKDEEKKCRGRDRYHKSSCCSEADDIKAHSEHMKELKKQCFNEVRAAAKQSRALAGDEQQQPMMDIFSCERMNKTKSEIVCVMQCVAKKQNLIDDNGDLKLADLTKYVKEELLIGAEWQKAMADKTIAKCAEEAREEASKPRTNPNACNPSAIKFGHCVWREVQFACPADKIQDMQKCQKLRERLVKKDQTLFLAEQQAVDAQ